ncbi:MAG: hypothetical protein ABJA71_07760 [Ginsengibacter sp.]
MQQSKDGLILQQVINIRKEQPRCGTRKLLVMLQPFFIKNNIFISRDRLFHLLSKNKLLIQYIFFGAIHPVKSGKSKAVITELTKIFFLLIICLHF